MSAEKPRAGWTVFVLPVIGLATAILQAIAAWRGSPPPPAPVQPRPPSTPPPVPPTREDAAVTAEQHEAIRREAAARRAPPAPVADLTGPDQDTTVLEPRDIQ